MNIEKISERKKNSVSQRAKKAMATVLTAATILTCAVGLASCDQDKDVSYSELMSMIDSDTQEYNAGFDPTYFMIGHAGHKYILAFVDDIAVDNASYNITKKQFETIKKSVSGLSVEDGVKFLGDEAVMISNEILKLDQMGDVRKILANAVDKQDPYRVEQENRTPYDGNANIDPLLSTFKQTLEGVKALYTQYLCDSEFQDFDINGIDEIIIKEVQARIPYVIEEVSIADGNYYTQKLKDKNDTALSDVYAIEIRDYYDSNNDGIDDSYMSIEFYDYECDNTKILLDNLEEYRSKDDKNIQFKDGNWVISSDVCNGGYDAVDECLCQVAEALFSIYSYHKGSFIDAPIETPTTAD